MMYSIGEAASAERSIPPEFREIADEFVVEAEPADGGGGELRRRLGVVLSNCEAMNTYRKCSRKR